jgi:hypothetical protein
LGCIGLQPHHHQDEREDGGLGEKVEDGPSARAVGHDEKQRRIDKDRDAGEG